MAKRSKITLEITAGAIFGALSVVVAAFITPIIPRIPGWYIAIYDPIAIIWIVCFLIFGKRAGLLSLVIGTFGLVPFDPSGAVFAFIGPLMKFCATLPFILIPYYILKLYKEEEGVRNSQKLKDRRNYIITGAIATFVRICLMTVLNILLFITLWAPFLYQANLAFLGLPSVSAWSAIIIGAIIINLYSSVLDLTLSYSIVYGLKLDEKFEIW